MSDHKKKRTNMEKWVGQKIKARQSAELWRLMPSAATRLD